MRAADAAILIITIVVCWSLYRAHKDRNGLSHFNLFDLLVENGRVSKVSCIVMGAFGVSSWVILRLTIDGKLTEGYLTIYNAAWVAPLIAKMFSPPPPAGTTVVEQSTKTTKTVDGGGTMSADTVNIKADTANVNSPKP